MMTVAEGEGRARNVVIEFESFEAAKVTGMPGVKHVLPVGDMPALLLGEDSR